MPTLNLNLASAPDEIPVISAGIYEGVVKTLIVEPSADGQSQNLIAEVTVSTPGEFLGTILKSWFSLKETAMKFTVVSLRNFATSGEVEPVDFDEDTDLMIGKTVKFSVSNKEYDGRLRANIDRWLYKPEDLA